MYFAIYDPVTGVIRKGLQGPSMEWALSNDLLAGELVIGCPTEVDGAREAVDVMAAPPALIERLRVVTPGELIIAVNRERGRRIEAGKVIDGIAVTGSDEDARNLTNLALAAQLRMATGDITTTVFRDGNNLDHDLTPAQVLSLWRQSAEYVSALYAASWLLKAMDPIPQDVTNDAHWPEGRP